MFAASLNVVFLYGMANVEETSSASDNKLELRRYDFPVHGRKDNQNYSVLVCKNRYKNLR